MLKDMPMHTTIPASDLERAKKFYSEKLGLEPISETPGGVRYHCADGTRFIIYPTPNAGKSPNTLAGWTSQDIEKDVATLREKGLEFEEYDMPGLKTTNGIADRGFVKSAFFKDSEGNTLGIVQFTD